MAWICYILAIILYNMGTPYSAYLVYPLIFGMLIHWKYWLVGIGAFFVGAGWKRPL